MYLRGNQGEALANESVEAVQDLVSGLHPPDGMKAYVTGPAALAADQHIVLPAQPVQQRGTTHGWGEAVRAAYTESRICRIGSGV